MEYIKHFSIANACSYAWKTLFKHAGFLASLSLIASLLGTLLMYARSYVLHEDIFVLNPQCKDLACIATSLLAAAKTYVVWKIIFGIVTFIVSAMIISVALRIALDLYYTGKSSFRRIFLLVSRVFGRLFLLYALVGTLFFGAFAIYFLPKVLVFFFAISKLSVVVLWLARSVGFILLVLCAYVTTRLMFAPVYLLDKQSSIRAACKASYAMTKRHFLRSLLLVLLCSLVILAITVASIFIFAALFVLLHGTQVPDTPGILLSMSLAFLGFFIEYFFAWLFFFALTYAYDKLFAQTFETIAPNPLQFM